MKFPGQIRTESGNLLEHRIVCRCDFYFVITENFKNDDKTRKAGILEASLRVSKPSVTIMRNNKIN